MNWFLDLSTRTKLFVSFGFLILLLIIVISSAYSSVSGLLDSQRSIYESEQADVLDIQRVNQNQAEMRAALLMMIVETNRAKIDQYNQLTVDHSQENTLTLQRIEDRNRKDPGFLEILTRYRSIRDAYKQTREETIIPLIQAGELEQAREMISSQQEQRYAELRSISRELLNREVDEITKALQKSEEQWRQTTRILFSTGFLAVVFSLLMVGYLNSILATPLARVAHLMEQVSQGDLTVPPMSTQRRDEVGLVAGSAERMIRQLRKMNEEIHEGITTLASSASEILSASTQIASGASQTTAAVSETSTTVQEVKQTAELAHEKAQRVAEIAQNAAQASQRGRRSVEESLEGMQEIKAQVENIAQRILQLNEQSQAISNIITTVNEVAEQSNLLAVNAAIEAAKAGESGRGFAVVAQEVRSLAAQSKQATADVRSILRDIQKSANEAVMAAEQGNRICDSGLKRSTQAGEAIRALSESINSAAQAASQIKASSQQQLAGVDQVSIAMQNIMQASSQNVAGTKQTETGARDLNELGQRLKNSIARFKI